MVKLVVSKGTAKNKKWKAEFFDDKGKRIKVSQFGDSRYSDYTIHKDKERRERYRSRHKVYLKNQNYMSPAFLSYYILWGDSQSLKTNISNYKKKFNLK